MKKKLLSVILSIFMVFGCFINTINAEGTPKEVGTTITIDDYFVYTVTSVGTPNTVELSNGKYYTGSELNIPEEIEDENGVHYTVTRIGKQALFYNDNFTSVSIPNTVTSIGEEAFLCCDGFSEIIIPSSVITIDTGAFQQCGNLASVTFSETSQLTTIGTRAFCWSEKIESIIIPASVTSIGDDALRECDLTTVTFEGATPPEINSSAFMMCYGIENIYVPKDSLGLYRIALGDTFGDYVRKIPTDTDVSVESLLPDDFPSEGSLLKWQNDNGALMYIDDNEYLVSEKGDVSDWISLSVTYMMASLLENGNYYYKDAGHDSEDIFTFTFVMDEGDLSSIMIEGFDGDYSDLNGTYVMQDMPTVGELLAKADDSFPTTVQAAWADYDDGCYMYVDNGYLKLYDIKTNVITSLVATNADALISENNQFMFTTADEKNGYFYIYNDELTCIDFYIDEDNYIYYSFSPLDEDETVTTLEEIFDTAGTGFPKNKTDAWTDYSGHYVFIEDDELVIYEGDTKLDSIGLNREVKTNEYYLYLRTANDASFSINLNEETFDDILYISYYSNDLGDIYFYPYNEILDAFSSHLNALWANGNGMCFYIDSMYFYLYDNTGDSELYEYSGNSVFDMNATLSDNKYTIVETGSESGQTITFTLHLDDDGYVEKVEVEGYTGDYINFNGIYDLLLTIRDILPDDFPSDEAGELTNTWKNDNGINLFLTYNDDNYFCFEDDDNTFCVINFIEPVEYALPVKESDSYYSYEMPALWDISIAESEPFDCSFAMKLNVDENGIVESIEVDYSGDSKYNNINGTYVPPIPQITIADILNTVEGGFPASHDSGWIKTENGNKVFLDGTTLKFDGTTISTDKVVIEDGDNYKLTEQFITCTFIMESNVLKSIEFTMAMAPAVSGTYVPYQYTNPSISIPVGYTEDIEFVTNGKYVDQSTTPVTVKINNESLDSNNYTVSSGSTHVILKSSYVKTLQAGTYVIEIKMDGYDSITSTFTITGSNPGPSPTPRHVVLDTSVE